LDVKDSIDAENQNVVIWGRHNGMSQQWDIIYHDAVPAEPKKGDLNKFFGFYIGKPFHIVSEYGTRKYLDIRSNSIYLKTQNGFDT